MPTGGGLKSADEGDQAALELAEKEREDEHGGDDEQDGSDTTADGGPLLCAHLPMMSGPGVPATETRLSLPAVDLVDAARADGLAAARRACALADSTEGLLGALAFIAAEASGSANWGHHPRRAGAVGPGSEWNA